MGKRCRRWVALCCLAALAGAAGASLGRAQTVDSELWGVDNTVFAVARLGDTLYVGGAFRRVGPCTGGAVALPKHGADPRKPFPQVAGYVYSIGADGNGGWFLSGNFTAVGGVPRYCLAHVLSDGSVAAWNPNPNYVSYGTGGLLVAGNTVYVSGGFATISGKPRLYVAALDATTGEALDWDAHSNGLVTPLAIRGNTLYVGGKFSRIGGEPRNNIAALDAVTGEATAWNPDAGGGVGSPTGDGGVWSMLVGDSTVYVGGSFSRIGGQERSMLAELDLETGLATGWNPNVRGPGTPYPFIASLVRQGDRLYVGGSFSSVGGQARQSLAAFDLPSGLLTDWNPGAGARSHLPEIYVMRGDGSSIYVGGWFQSIGGQARNCVAELDGGTGAASEWNPDPSSVVYALGIGESTVCMGGTFRSLGMVARHNLAAFDLRTGRVTDWNPNPDGVIVYALAAAGGTIYAGGDFSQIGGAPRLELAALDGRTGLATGWSPNPDQAVRALLVRGGTVYVGGGFRQIGGRARRYLAAVDAATGAATDWNPDPNDGVIALALRGDTLYTGGWFWQMGGQIHRSLAAVNALTGAVLPWQLDTDGVVNALAAGDSTVYAGGIFQHVNGVDRLNLLAFDASGGTLRDWAPSPNGPREDYYTASVDVLATRGNTVFVGGDFTTIAGGQQASLAALHGVSGALLEWDPKPDQSVHALEVSGDRLYAGGYFQAAAGLPHLALMGVTLPGYVPPPDTVSYGPSLVFAPLAPNPARASALVRYVLPADAAVTLAVYDLLGRRVATLLRREREAAGEHHHLVATDGLPAGCYLYRLEAGSLTATRKLFVVP
ncbi:MAG: hypothetical protein A2W29_04525 [Gemmatimonadetes bacterium RBG_16_66_8]|nr:MAG: hypothetical protein A2W29_04525 [Gemmatimonadetes bacterium RBG_16_66_8]